MDTLHDHPRPWNKGEILERLGGDEQLLQELIQIFLDEYPKLLHRLRLAITASDADAVMRESHSIKGEVSCLGAQSAAQTAKQLETMGRDNHLSGAEQAFASLEDKLSALNLMFTRSFAAHP